MNEQKKYFFIFLVVFKISEIVKCEFDGRSNRSWCEKSSFTFCQSLSKAWWRSTNYSRLIFFHLLKKNLLFLLSILSYWLWSATNQYREKILFSLWWIGWDPRFTSKGMLHFCYHEGKWEIQFWLLFDRKWFYRKFFDCLLYFEVMLFKIESSDQ